MHSLYVSSHPSTYKKHQDLSVEVLVLILHSFIKERLEPTFNRRCNGIPNVSEKSTYCSH